MHRDHSRQGLLDSTAASIRDAAENLAYWQRQKILRVETPAKAQAGALALIWKSTLTARQDKLTALQAMHI